MTTNKTPRIAVIGSNMVDLVTYVNRMPVRGETVEAPSFEMGHGGKGANQAVAAAKLGAAVVMVTKVGDDMFADATIRNLASFGVDTKHARRVAGRSSGVAPIMVEPSGENSILIVKGANSDLSPNDIERAAEDLKTCDIILLQLEIPLETVYAAIAFGKRHGVKTLLNPAPATPELDPEKIRDASFLVPNETELAILTGMPVGTEDEIAAAARSLIAKGIGTVIVTMGARGALLVTASDTREHCAGPRHPGRYHRRRRRLRRQLRALLRRRLGPRRRRSTRRSATPPIRSPAAARRKPTQRKANSRPFAPACLEEARSSDAGVRLAGLASLSRREQPHRGGQVGVAGALAAIIRHPRARGGHFRVGNQRLGAVELLADHFDVAG